ncbi:hypothetical protein B484DRAFT_399422 [Ochromonadaceae sp. CCMP2298]|nr:hypothetical protein B484DRAFT_399422 [Ochromonadaceae sp. CCMP2298]
MFSGTRRFPVSPSSHRKRGTPDRSGSDSKGSRSDACNDATTTFWDAARRTIKRVKGSSMQVIRASKPLRAFATPARVDALLATVSSGATDRGPSWYNLPPYYDLVWWVQRETNSAIATQIVYGNWIMGSLRQFHFLPAASANSIGNNHFKCTYADWVLAFWGLAVTLGAFWDNAYQIAFQEMHNYLCKNQAGNGYSFEYLEAVSIDIFARISSAANDPNTAVILPGATDSVIPLKFTPQTWAAAFLSGFHGVVELPSTTRHGYSDARARRHLPKGVRTCFISFLRQYKINLKASNALPVKCEAACKRPHYKDIKGELTKAQVLDIARATTLVSEENRALLITAISADANITAMAAEVNTFASVLGSPNPISPAALLDILFADFSYASDEFGIRAAQMAHSRLTLRRVHHTFGATGTAIPGLNLADFQRLCTVSSKGIHLHLPANFLPTGTPLPLCTKYIKVSTAVYKQLGTQLAQGTVLILPLSVAIQELRDVISAEWDPILHPTLAALMILILAAVDMYGWELITL